MGGKRSFIEMPLPLKDLLVTIKSTKPTRKAGLEEAGRRVNWDISGLPLESRREDVYKVARKN